MTAFPHHRVQLRTPDAAERPASSVQAFRFHAGEAQRVPVDLAALHTAREEDDTFIWIDVVSPTPDVMDGLRTHFDLHPLAIEDALHAHQRAKVETYSTFWFVVMHSAHLDDGQRLSLNETALFVGSRYIITVQYQVAFDDQDIVTRWALVPEAWRHSGSSLLYVFFDTLVDGFGPLADEVERELRQVRITLASGNPVQPPLLRRIFALEELSNELYAVALTLRDILPPFMHAVKDAPVGDEAQAPYYRDVHDHAAGVVERLGAELRLSDRAFDIYQSLASQQQGVVARQLTVVATIFLPLTFLTGFFGQNFDYLIKHIASERSFYLWGVGSYVLSLLAILLLIRRVARG